MSIGNDTGPMHLISKGCKKTIVLFTKFSNPKLCAPLGSHVTVLKYNNEECSKLANKTLSIILEEKNNYLLN